jgi:hypothetical protein
MVQLNRRKRADYATEADGLKNFRTRAAAMELEGFTALEAANQDVVMKTCRINNLRGRLAANESVLDSYKDRAVYAVLAYLLAKEEADAS